MSTPTGSGWEFTVSKMTLDNPSRYEASSLVFPATYAHLKWTRGLTIVLRNPATRMWRPITAPKSCLVVPP